MVPLLSEVWRFVEYLLTPDDPRPGGRKRSALAGTAKTLFWACLAVLAGLGLGRLGG
ncbi:MAG: hypothetical protein KKF77_01995 [Proteobacteria bacterium]|nr:hypothetical protein [Pseudomonadota bacterium]